MSCVRTAIGRAAAARRRPLAVLAALVVAGAAAWSPRLPAQQSAAAPPPSAEASQADARATAAPPGARSTAAAPSAALAKPVAAFSVEHTVVGEPAVGVPLELRLALHAQAPLDDVTVTLSADDGLYIDPAGAQLSAAAVSRDEPAEWSVQVVPLAEGAFKVRIYAEGVLGGMRQGRSVVVPIHVGAASSEKSEDAADARRADKDRDAEPMIRLPAEERR